MLINKKEGYINSQEAGILQSRRGTSLDTELVGIVILDLADSRTVGYKCLLFFSKDFIYLFLERGEGKVNKRERNINVWLRLAHPLQETWPAIQACALTGNRTSNLLVHRPTLNPLSYTSQDCLLFISHPASGILLQQLQQSQTCYFFRVLILSGQTGILDWRSEWVTEKEHEKRVGGTLEINCLNTNFAKGQLWVQIGRMLESTLFNPGPKPVPKFTLQRSFPSDTNQKDTAEAYAKWNNKYYIPTLGNKAILHLSYVCTVPWIVQNDITMKTILMWWNEMWGGD